ncbi:4Fe-4S dicluster domain-containing protein [Carboxydothermus pertinax]|uniref:4Fe-4S ferredoxin n=1 Tax=Carboxydothermus pertinax TaxID=870242 RepID=A0A1L8CWR9_9THEO|nr:4Fe-4S dicluster domain-containing protein [Carboxydothermus pertinax]GAV23347.1 4Fe-4S ferredoxin [Carboxydothermus pertinax]
MARYGMVIDLRTCVGCQACSAACATENQTPYWSDKWRTRVLDIEKGEYPNTGRHFVPTICMHCEEPACLTICPSQATIRDENGSILVNYDTCLGCKACMAACPYGARYVYDKNDVAKNLEIHGELSQHNVVHIDKCTFCFDRVERGLEPACVATCPAKARIFGDLDDPNSEVAKLVAAGIAKPLRPDLNTKPKVFYIY